MTKYNSLWLIMIALVGVMFFSQSSMAASPEQLEILPNRLNLQEGTATPITLSTAPQHSGVVLLSPFAGPASSPITVHGQGWQANEQIIIYIQDSDGAEYTVASTLVHDDGTFQVSFFIPAYWANQNILTIVTRPVVGAEYAAQAFYTITDAVSAEATPETNATLPQGIITSDRINVRSGPGTAYYAIGQVVKNQVVYINGQNNGWWRINFPTSVGDYGWVTADFVLTTNVENVAFIPAAAPPPTATPTITPTPTQATQCNAGEWSSCGGAGCTAEYVSQCDGNGEWGQCVWDPGTCSPYNQDYYEQNGGQPYKPPER